MCRRDGGGGGGDLGVVGWGDECAVNGGDRESPVSKHFSAQSQGEM